MPVFNYIVLNREGAKEYGTIDAPNYDMAMSHLRDQGYVPLDCEPVKQQIKIEDIIAKYRSIPLAALTVFARQLATMIGAEMPAMQAVGVLEEQQDNPKFKEVLRQVTAALESGRQLNEALADHPEVFDTKFVSMVRAGESAGNLAEALQDVAAQLEKDLQMRRTVKSATMYPKVVSGIAALALALMLLFIVPIFADMFKQAVEAVPPVEGEEPPSAELPLPTRIVVGASHLLFPDKDKDLSFWLEVLARSVVFVIVLLAIRMLVRRILRDPKARAWWDGRKLRLPMKIGPLITKIAVARFSRSFASLLHAQVPAGEAMEIVADTSGNFVMAEAIRESKERLLAGSTIHEPLARSGVFPNMVVRMVEAGEETGQLETMLTKVAEHYEADVDADMKAFNSLIEPLMIVVVGLMIGAVLIACYLPMLDIYNKIG